MYFDLFFKFTFKSIRDFLTKLYFCISLSQFLVQTLWYNIVYVFVQELDLRKI